MNSNIKQWSVSIFSIVGAFFIFGISSGLISGYFGFWEKPISGFFAAFTTVFMAYISAPKYKKIYAILFFVLGAIAAYFALEPSFYPVSHPNAYEPTHLPLIVTLSGGVIAIVIIALLGKNKQNA